MKIAGVCGRAIRLYTRRILAVAAGSCGLLSLSAYRQDSQEAMLEHCRKVAEHIPLIGFYL